MLAFYDVDRNLLRQSAVRGLLVFGIHVESRFFHGFDNGVEADFGFLGVAFRGRFGKR